MICRFEKYGFVNLNHYLYFDVVKARKKDTEEVWIYLKCVKDSKTAPDWYEIDCVSDDHLPSAFEYFYKQEIANSIRAGGKYLDFEEVTMQLNEKFEEFGLRAINIKEIRSK